MVVEEGENLVQYRAGVVGDGAVKVGELDEGTDAEGEEMVVER